jgi:hypothetical protein
MKEAYNRLVLKIARTLATHDPLQFGPVATLENEYAVSASRIIKLMSNATGVSDTTDALTSVLGSSAAQNTKAATEIWAHWRAFQIAARAQRGI